MSNYWLMKSEPETFSLADLKRRKKTLWDGVRNYQARNFMTQDMKIGDQVLFYHSSCAEPGVYGRAEVSAAARPDPSQFLAESPYYDPKASQIKPRWFAVEVSFVEEFKQPILLDQIRREPRLAKMLLLRPGQRLSIQPTTEQEFRHILRLGSGSRP